MKLFSILLFVVFFVIKTNGQATWNFINKLYIIDNKGNIDSVSFGNNNIATTGIDSILKEQNLINISWDSIEIRSIQRTSNLDDCPINYWNVGINFNENVDLKIDIRKNGDFNHNSIFFVFKIHAIHYPIEVYSNFQEMFNNSSYNSWTRILKHYYNCSYDNIANCVPQYEHLFTITDSLERYITVRLDFETGIVELQNKQHNLILNNPVDNFVKLDYSGLIQIYEINGKFITELYITENEPFNIGYLKSGLYLIKTKIGTIKMLKN